LGVGPKSAVGLTVKGTAAPSSPLKYAVSADPPAGTADPEPANNKATLTNAVGQPDLAVSVSGATDPVNAGTTVPLTYTVTNRGRSDLTGVVVTATLPDGFGLDSSPPGCTATGQKLPCPAVPTLPARRSAALVVTVPAGGSCSVAGNLHTCAITDPVPVDTSVVVRITSTVSASAAGTTVTDAAFVSALENEPDATDNGGSSTGVIEGDIRTKQSGQAAPGGSAMRRLVAAGGRLAWWSWAGGGTVLLGLILLGIALRRSRRLAR